MIKCPICHLTVFTCFCSDEQIKKLAKNQNDADRYLKEREGEKMNSWAKKIKDFIDKYCNGRCLAHDCSYWKENGCQHPMNPGNKI